MTERATPRVAVIADTSLQRHVLQQALLGHGYEVVLNADPARVDDAALECAPDLWLVDLTQQDDSPLLDSLLEQDRAPVLFGEGHAPERHTEHYPRWERRLIAKLKRLIGDPSDGVGDSLGALLDEERPARLEIPGDLAAMPLQAGEPAREVWLLAASLGGPAAVKAFLAAPTPDSLTGLLLPLSDRTLLLPNVAVAELIAYRNPQVAAGLPQWYLGQVAWRDLRLPLLSFETASSGERQPVLGSSARVVVINALGGRPHVKFLALLVQGIPRSVRLDANLAATAAPLAALELAAVDIGGETARIPDLAGLEEKLADAGLI